MPIHVGRFKRYKMTHAPPGRRLLLRCALIPHLHIYCLSLTLTLGTLRGNDQDQNPDAYMHPNQVVDSINQVHDRCATIPMFNLPAFYPCHLYSHLPRSLHDPKYTSKYQYMASSLQNPLFPNPEIDYKYNSTRSRSCLFHLIRYGVRSTAR